MYVSSIDQCRSTYGGLVDNLRHMCAKFPVSKLMRTTNSCDKDPGIPAMHRSASGHWELAGLASFGRNVCVGQPGVFVAMPYYARWICCYASELKRCKLMGCNAVTAWGGD